MHDRSRLCSVFSFCRVYRAVCCASLLHLCAAWLPRSTGGWLAWLLEVGCALKCGFDV